MKIFKNESKSYASDRKGHRKRDFHEETIPIDTGETDFRSTVTHFMNFSHFCVFRPDLSISFLIAMFLIAMVVGVHRI